MNTHWKLRLFLEGKESNICILYQTLNKIEYSYTSVIRAVVETIIVRKMPQFLTSNSTRVFSTSMIQR